MTSLIYKRGDQARERLGGLSLGTPGAVGLLTLGAAFALGLAATSCRLSAPDASPSFHSSPSSDREQAFGVPERSAAPQSIEALGEKPDLEGYIKIGLSRNAALKASHGRWRAAVERIAQRQALPDPRLTFAHFIEEVQTRTGPQENRISLSQTFPWFGELDLRGRVASHEAESLWWKVEAEGLAVVTKIKKAYYEYAYLNQAIGITKENLGLLENVEPVIQSRFQAGETQKDLLRLQVEIGKVENEFETLKDYRPALSVGIVSALNIERTETLPWPDPVELNAVELEYSELARRVARDNPSLKALSHEIEAEARRIELADLEKYPDFTVGVDYIDTGGAVTRPRPSGSGDDPISVSLSFNLPIWRKKLSAAVREAEAAHRAATDTLVETRNDLIASLAIRLYELDDAGRQVSLYRDTLIPRALQALELTEIAYESGDASLTDIIDTQRELLAFQLALQRSASNYEQRLAELEELCGGTLR